VKLAITGSQGNVGRRLMAAFPSAIGIDRAEGAAIRADLATVDYGDPRVRRILSSADALVHLATSADPAAPEDVPWQAVANAARLMRACAEADVKRLVLASSDWAEPQHGLAINSYGHSKRILEAMAAMYANGEDRYAVALRIGWVPASTQELADAPAWLAANYWSDERLIAEIRLALGV
jgi:nucleoside-diphosphate-sugar epimerase